MGGNVKKLGKEDIEISCQDGYGAFSIGPRDAPELKEKFAASFHRYRSSYSIPGSENFVVLYSLGAAQRLPPGQ